MGLSIGSATGNGGCSASCKTIKKQNSSSGMITFHPSLCTSLFFIVLFTIPALFLLHTVPITTSIICSGISFASPNLDQKDDAIINEWPGGDLRFVQFAWNRLSFTTHQRQPPPLKLKIAVFSRKWPLGATPGGMERHAHTLHTALAHRGHQVHVFTSPADSTTTSSSDTIITSSGITIHSHEGEAGRWRYNKAWEQFQDEGPFDVVHSESVALPHWLARQVPNLAVSWHGIALESFQSDIVQELTRKPNEPISPALNRSGAGVLAKILNEIRFFKSYAHHVAISDSCGEMLRDVYQIPEGRVHVIVNGVDEADFGEDARLGREFRAKIGIPEKAAIVFGVAGRLVKDKGHPLLHQAFSNLTSAHPDADVFLVVAGSGPWQQRYKELGRRVIVLGTMSPSELKGFYNSIDVFVNPTLRPQGLDLTLMEAMMSGKPVMASRFPSIKGTVVVREELGYMFAPNAEALLEALETVVKDGSRRLADKGKACRRYAASMFTATKMALAYERLFLCIKDHSFCTYP